MGKGPDLPRFRPEPTRLTLEGRRILEQLREENVPRYSFYRESGYIPIGIVPERDPFILRRGRVVDVQNARTHAVELMIAILQKKYKRKGQDVEIIGEKGAIRLRRGKQAEVDSPQRFGIDEKGITFYVRQRRFASQAAVSEVTYSDTSASLSLEPIVIIPRAFYGVFSS